MEYELNLNTEEQIKSIEKEIDYIKRLINKTNSKIKKYKKNNLYLTYDDITFNDSNNNLIAIKTKGNIKPNIKILAESEECKNESNNDYFSPNFSFNLTNDFNNFQNEYAKENFDSWNINNLSCPSFMDKLKKENPIELLLISPNLQQNN